MVHTAMRRVVVLVLLAGIGLAGPTAPARAAGTVAFGAAQSSSPGVSRQQAVSALEGSIQRQLAFVRSYDLWDSPFPDSTEAALDSSGHGLFMSVKAKRTSGAFVPWAAIAAAGPGDPLYQDMVSWANRLKAFATPVTFSFNHEAETSNSAGSGTATQYVAAYRAFAGVIRQSGATNVRLAWTSAVRNFSAAPGSASYAPAFYPGDAWVDDLAVDAYNMYCRRADGQFSRPWRSLQQLLDPWLAFAAQHPGPQMVVAEWGSPEDPAATGRKAQWIDDAHALFKQPAYARVRAVSYWNQLSHNFAGCDFRVTSSPSALAAFTAMGKDPFYSGTVR